MQRVFFFQILLNTDFVSEVDLNLNSKAVPLVMILAKQERLRIILQHFQFQAVCLSLTDILKSGIPDQVNQVNQVR